MAEERTITHNGACFTADELRWPVYVHSLAGLELPVDIARQRFDVTRCARPARAKVEQVQPGLQPGEGRGECNGTIRLLLHALEVELGLLRQAGARAKARAVSERIAKIQRRLKDAVRIETDLVRATSEQAVRAHWARQKERVLGADLATASRTASQHRAARSAASHKLAALRAAERKSRSALGQTARKILGTGMASFQRRQQARLDRLRGDKLEAARAQQAMLRTIVSESEQQHSRQKEQHDEETRLCASLGWQDRGEAEVQAAQIEAQHAAAVEERRRGTGRLRSLRQAQQESAQSALARRARDWARYREAVSRGRAVARIEQANALRAEADACRCEKQETRLAALGIEQEYTRTLAALRLKATRERLKNLEHSDLLRVRERGEVMMRDLLKESKKTQEVKRGGRTKRKLPARSHGPS